MSKTYVQRVHDTFEDLDNAGQSSNEEFRVAALIQQAFALAGIADELRTKNLIEFAVLSPDKFTKRDHLIIGERLS